MPLLCFWDLLGSDPQRQRFQPNRSTIIHLLKLQSAQGRSIQQTKEIEGLTAWLQGRARLQDPMINEGLKELQWKQKNTFKSPQVEEKYHMTKLMNLLDSHHKAFASKGSANQQHRFVHPPKKLIFLKGLSIGAIKEHPKEVHKRLGWDNCKGWQSLRTFPRNLDGSSVLNRCQKSHLQKTQ